MVRATTRSKHPNQQVPAHGRRGVAALVGATADALEDPTIVYPGPVENEASPGGGGVTVDNQSDPPAEVTTIIAPGSLISNDEATLPFSHPFGEAATGADNANAAHVITAEDGEADASINATAVDEFADVSLWARTTGDGDAYATANTRAGGSGEARSGPTAHNTGTGAADVVSYAQTVSGRARTGLQAFRGADEVSLTVVVTAAGLKEFILVGLPTADPGVAGRLYSNGVPSAGVPKALMVSGG